MNHILPQTRFFVLFFRQYGSRFNQFDLIGQFGEITQNDGHCDVRGHSWSPFSVLTENPHAASYTLSYLAPFPRYRNFLIFITVGVEKRALLNPFIPVESQN